MSLYIVTALVNGERKALSRGRLVKIDNGTVFMAPGAARKAMEKAQRNYRSAADWKVVKWNGNWHPAKGAQA